MYSLEGHHRESGFYSVKGGMPLEGFKENSNMA